MRIRLTSLFVDDQDKALKFYTETLGFQVKTDAAYGPEDRWLSVVSPEDPDGTELLLQHPGEAARRLQESDFAAGQPATAFATDDCRREYRRLSERGVTFTLEPTRMPYGGTDAVLDDGCGNLICLHQD